MTPHIVVQESVVVPDFKFKSHSFIEQKIRKKYLPLNGLCRKLRKKGKKSVMTGSRSRDIPLQTLAIDLVYFQGPAKFGLCRRT